MLKSSPQAVDKDALYAELRTRYLRRSDWRRVRRLGLVFLAIVAVAVALAVIIDFGRRTLPLFIR